MLLDLAGQGPALLQLFPHPQAAAEAPPNRPQGFGLLRPGQGRDQAAGASLLHQHRLGEDLQGPRLPQSLLKKGQILRGGVVDLGLLLHHRLQGGPGGNLRLSQEQAQLIRAIQLPRAQANAQTAWGEGRCRTEALRQGHHQGHTGGGRQFSRGKTSAARQGNPMARGELQHGRHGNRQEAMGGLIVILELK